MEITKKVVDEMMAEVDLAIKTIAEKYGLSGTCSQSSYNNKSIDFKVRVEDTQSCWNFAILGTGLKPEDLGREIMISGRKMRIRGWDFAAKTNKILLKEVSTGRNYCAPVRAVISAIQTGLGNAGKETKSPDAAAAEENAQKRAFETLGWIVGLPKTVKYGQVVRVSGMELRLVEINRRAPKYPVVGEDVKTGKRYKLSVADVIGEC